MKRYVFSVVLALFTGVLSPALADEQPAPVPEVVQLTPGDIKWRPGPGGVSFALVYGSPAKPEHYAMLVKYPPDFKAIPHFHPIEQVVVVVEGTVYSGLGESFDAGKLIKYGSGSVFTEPLNTPHFTLTKAEGATVAITGIGPHSTRFVKSSSSPEKK